jgi:hypothetical protein
MTTRRIKQIADIIVEEMEDRLYKDATGRWLGDDGKFYGIALLEDVLDDIYLAVDVGELSEAVTQILAEMRAG